jgi:SAM-dependent methyltransferase
MNQEEIWDYFQSDGLEIFSSSIPRLSFLINKAGKLSRQKPTVLNIGIGNGWLERECVRRGWNTYSLDPSEVAVKKLEDDGLRAKAGYIEAIPYEDNFFDICFCSEVLEHLSDEQLYSGLKEIKRILKKGGYLIGTVPFNEYLLDNQVVCPDCKKVFHRWGHLQSFDKVKMKNILKEAGFEVITVDTYAFADFSKKKVKDKFKSVVRWVLGRLGTAISQPNLLFVVKK